MAEPRIPLSTALPGRLQDMQRRLERRLGHAALAPDAAARVLAIHADVLLHRLRLLGDEEHFEALHPSRTLLILLDDCDVGDADVLEAAACVESEHETLRYPRADALARAVPTPEAGEALLEQLILASTEVRLIALAERLDHARHLHLRDPATWRPFHASITTIYAPVAQRTEPRLARRYAWWTGMFSRRFLDATSEH